MAEALPFILNNSDTLTKQYFNKSGYELLQAALSNQIPPSEIASKFDKKLVSLNVYYDELSFVSIEEDPKTEVKIIK